MADEDKAKRLEALARKIGERSPSRRVTTAEREKLRKLDARAVPRKRKR